MKRLISLAQAGDPDARQRLVTALRPRLASMARHYARCCHEDSDDLLGEAWFAVFDALAVTDVNIGQPEQYLLKRARWRILDYIKWVRRRRCAEPLGDLEAEQAADVAPQVVAEATVSEVAENLSGTQQVVLRRLLRGDTWREVADHLGCSSANVAYHVRRIREHCMSVVGEAALVPAE